MILKSFKVRQNGSYLAICRNASYAAYTRVTSKLEWQFCLEKHEIPDLHVRCIEVQKGMKQIFLFYIWATSSDKEGQM